MIGPAPVSLAVLALLFKSKLRLEAENAVLRHQLIVLRRRLNGRIRLTNHDRWFLIRAVSLVSINPEGSHNHPARDARALASAGFRCYWRWKSHRRGGRPRIDMELRVLIRRMSVEICFGARHAFTANCSSSGLRSRSRASPSTWSKRRGPPSQGWRTFLHNHAPDIAAMDLFVVPTHQFRPALCLNHRPARPQRPRLDQRHSKSDGRMGCPSNNGSISLDEAPRYMIRDRDRIYGSVVTRRLRAMAFGTSRLHQPRPGRMALPNG